VLLKRRPNIKRGGGELGGWMLPDRAGDFLVILAYQIHGAIACARAA